MNILPLLKRIKEFKNNNEQLNEENTKLFCILPLFKYLGYDIFSPTDVRYEYCACLREDKSERCDLVIFDNNKKPFIIVEMKSFGKDLSQFNGQLKSYFVSTSAKYAILTNGDDYWFYEASQKIDIKDENPIKSIRLSNLISEDISYLNNYIKDILLPLDNEKLNTINIETTPIIITKEIIKEVKSKRKDKLPKESTIDSIDLFIKRLDINNILGKHKEQIFNEYTNFCNNNNYTSASSHLFTKKIKEQFSLNILSKNIKGITNNIFVNDAYLKKINDEIQKQKEEQAKIKLQQKEEQERTKQKELLNKLDIQNNNSVYVFYKDNTLLEVKNNKTEDIYSLYIEYCKSHNLEISHKIDFCKKIIKYYKVNVKIKSMNGKVCKIFI